MPLARASPANSCFQASKPADVLPHWAALAGEVGHARRAKAKKAAVVSPLLLVIRKSLRRNPRQRAGVSQFHVEIDRIEVEAVGPCWRPHFDKCTREIIG